MTAVLFIIYVSCFSILFFFTEANTSRTINPWLEWVKLPSLSGYLASWDPPSILSSENGDLFAFVPDDSNFIFYTYQSNKTWNSWINTTLIVNKAGAQVYRNKSDFLIGANDEDDTSTIHFYRISSVLSDQPSVPRFDHSFVKPEETAWSVFPVYTDLDELHLFMEVDKTMYTATRRNGEYSAPMSLDIPARAPVSAAARIGGVIDVIGRNDSAMLHKTFNGSWQEAKVIDMDADPHTGQAALLSNTKKSFLSLIRIEEDGTFFQIKTFDNGNWGGWMKLEGMRNITHKSRFTVHQDSSDYLHILVKTGGNQLSLSSSQFPVSISPNDQSYTGETCNSTVPTCASGRICAKADSITTKCEGSGSPCQCKIWPKEFGTCISSNVCLLGDVCANDRATGDHYCYSCKLVFDSENLSSTDGLENCEGLTLQNREPSNSTVDGEDNRTPEVTPPSSAAVEEDSSSNDENGEDNEERSEGVCIHVEALLHLNDEELVFLRARRAFVYCDNNGNCATPGHIVIHNSKPKMMKTYCNEVTCTKSVKMVNSPKMGVGKRIPSRNKELQYTAFASVNEHRFEEFILSGLIWLGL